MSRQQGLICGSVLCLEILTRTDIGLEQSAAEHSRQNRLKAEVLGLGSESCAASESSPYAQPTTTVSGQMHTQLTYTKPVGNRSLVCAVHLLIFKSTTFGRDCLASGLRWC